MFSGILFTAIAGLPWPDGALQPADRNEMNGSMINNASALDRREINKLAHSMYGMFMHYRGE